MVVGIARVKDEADVIEGTLRRMATQVDRLIVADNASTDGTSDILDQLTAELPLTVLDDHEVGYFQSRQMSALAFDAAQIGAEWVVPFDADEVWYSPFGRIGDVLEDQPRASIITAELYDHVATGYDPAGPPVERIGWRRQDPAALRKVACRPLQPVTIHQGNHDASYGERVDGLLVIRHYPYRSPEQFISKVRNGAAAYAATDLPPTEGQHWRDYGKILRDQGEDVCAGIFREWFWVAQPDRRRDLIYDPCP